MSAGLDRALVAVALLASLAYALLALGPRTWRRAMLSRVAGWAGRAPGWPGMSALAARLGSAAGSPGGCGGCGSCGSGRGSAAPAAAETKIPLASIGHRRP